MAQQQVSTNTFTTAKWIVSADATQGTHTTIASALTAASSGDTIFIRPGTYTENLTLKAGVNLVAFPVLEYKAGASAQEVMIIGKSSANYTGTVSISGLRLQTNSDYVIEMTGSTAAILNVSNCYIESTNNTAINFSNSNSSSSLSIFQSTGNISAGTGAYFTGTGAGTLRFQYFTGENSILTTTANSLTNGKFFCYWSQIDQGISLTSFTSANINFSHINSSVSNTTSLTTVTSGSIGIRNSSFTSGTASAISIGASTTANIFSCTIESSNTNALTGAGTLNVSGIYYFNSTGSNVTTVSPKGFNLQGTFTPTIAFGGGSTGITYSSQLGEYTVVGNTVLFNAQVILTNKGSSTGSATLEGLPFAASPSTISRFSIPDARNITFDVNYIYAFAQLPSGGGTSTTLFEYGSAVAVQNLTNSNFSNTSALRFSGFYMIN